MTDLTELRRLAEAAIESGQTDDDVETQLRMESFNEAAHPCAVIELLDRLKNSEDSLKTYKVVYKNAIDNVDIVFQECSENPHPILPDFLRLGEDKFKGVVKLAKEHRSLLDRLARYRAALEDIVQRNEIQHWFNLDKARAALSEEQT